MENNIVRKIIFTIRDVLLPRYEGIQAQQYLYNHIQKGIPFMIARFGAVEIKAVLYGIYPPPINLLVKNYTYKCMPINAGFFPASDIAFKRFASIMKDAMLASDALFSWRPEEIFLKGYLRHSCKLSIGEIGPIDSPNYWMRALEGKKILVIHPFADTIRSQYEQHRDKIWNHAEVLPAFSSLETVRAVQTIAGNSCGFDSWFEAFDYMAREIEKKDFDIALLGCGAYGFPLAAHIKRMGKIAIHMGGSLQLVFGIKGKRWDNTGLYNDFWVSPSDDEKPMNLHQVEGGCYW